MPIPKNCACAPRWTLRLAPGHHLRSGNIHYPVDWVLLRDATRTLMKAV